MEGYVESAPLAEAREYERHMASFIEDIYFVTGMCLRHLLLRLIRRYLVEHSAHGLELTSKHATLMTVLGLQPVTRFLNGLNET